MGKRTEITKITVTGLERARLGIRMEGIIDGEILFNGTGETLTFVPTVPVELGLDSFSIFYNIVFNGANRSPNVIQVTYEMVHTEVAEVKEIGPNQMFVTREEVENIVDTKIKMLLSEMTEDDLDKLILEVRSRKSEEEKKRKVK